MTAPIRAATMCSGIGAPELAAAHFDWIAAPDIGAFTRALRTRGGRGQSDLASSEREMKCPAKAGQGGEGGRASFISAKIDWLRTSQARDLLFFFGVPFFNFEILFKFLVDAAVAEKFR